jgi:hypothetical protein
MAKKPKSRDPALEAAEGRFRDWCRRKIAADPRYYHVIPEDMVALYGGSGERYATEDCVHLLADLGARDAEDKLREPYRDGGTTRGDQKRAEAKLWQDKIRAKVETRILRKQSNEQIAKNLRLQQEAGRSKKALLLFAAEVRRSLLQKKP